LTRDALIFDNDVDDSDDRKQESLTTSLCCRLHWRWLFTQWIFTTSHHWTTHRSSVWRPWTKPVHLYLYIPHTVHIYPHLFLQICMYLCHFYIVDCKRYFIELAPSENTVLILLTVVVASLSCSLHVS